MENLPQWLSNAVTAAGMTAFAEGLDVVGNKSATIQSEQQDAIDPPGNLH
jgi:hypothetical protein